MRSKSSFSGWTRFIELNADTVDWGFKSSAEGNQSKSVKLGTTSS